MRKTWKLKMIWQRVWIIPIGGARVHLLTCLQAQKILRDLKSKISSQSKKNFVLEKDVRYLDSRIALLIQNRMALEEVCSEFLIPSPLYTALTVNSKMKWQATSKMLQICKRGSFQMTKRLRNTATYSSSYNPSPDTSHTFAV